MSRPWGIRVPRGVDARSMGPSEDPPQYDEDGDEFDSPYCECNNDLMLSELDSGKCATCGKAVLS
jgi:hypothetical protein